MRGTDEYAREMDACRARKRQRVTEIPTWQDLGRKTLSPLQRGHRTMDRIYAALNRVEEVHPPTLAQQECIDIILCALGPRIFQGRTFYDNEAAIKKRYGWKEMHKGLFFEAPRRFGKSTFLKILICILLVACPNIVIVVVANSQTAAGGGTGMFGQVREALAAWFGITKFDTDSETKGSLRYVAEDGDNRDLHCYSAGMGDR